MNPHYFLPRLIVGKELRLLRGDAFPGQISESELPFLNQLRCLPATPFGTAQYSLRVRSLSGLRIGTGGHMSIGGAPGTTGSPVKARD